MRAFTSGFIMMQVTAANYLVICVAIKKDVAKALMEQVEAVFLVE
jgi:hypothetical protein